MTYSKPEVSVLGDATLVIQGKNGGAPDSGHTAVGSYDLDEE